MSIFDRLKFWHKEDIPPMPEPDDLSAPPSLAQPQEPTFPQPFSTQPQEPSFSQPFSTPAQPFNEPFARAPFSAASSEPFSARQQYPERTNELQNTSFDRDIQVVIAKLDTLRVQMDNALQRLERIEQKMAEKNESWTKPFR